MMPCLISGCIRGLIRSVLFITSFAIIGSGIYELCREEPTPDNILEVQFSSVGYDRADLYVIVDGFTRGRILIASLMIFFALVFGAVPSLTSDSEDREMIEIKSDEEATLPPLPRICRRIALGIFVAFDLILSIVLIRRYGRAVSVAATYPHLTVDFHPFLALVIVDVIFLLLGAVSGTLLWVSDNNVLLFNEGYQQCPPCV